MKTKIHLTLVLFFLFFYSSYAQYYGNGFFCYTCDFGIEIGGTASNINGLDTSEKAGIYIGIYNSYEFNDTWAIRYGLGYANLGARSKEYKTNVVLHTMLIEPISVHYSFKNKFKTFTGVNIGSTIVSKNPYNEEEPGMTLFGKGIKFMDMSVFAGAGYKLTENIDLNLKYDLGLTNINDIEGSKDKWKKNWLTLSVAYTFR
ncbi:MULTISPECIES: outer membrane beta-barrel protein [unclassified Myroides]|uniref:outer membrane beta-barrel protein n=1 Tax=unclassified Myroides TaxID=2642485 RepID=UPI0015F8ADCA|nr:MULTISPECIES: outer membrane beta-barrel protein [unclassified Myroides]MBB1150732.1 outer membrane beta-barrel protein [Myroides sp. NP-2]MDM1407567.1 outer membrane beta-barrel protein [Myroides sp. DF42-4-2]